MPDKLIEAIKDMRAGLQLFKSEPPPGITEIVGRHEQMAQFLLRQLNRQNDALVEMQGRVEELEGSQAVMTMLLGLMNGVPEDLLMAMLSGQVPLEDISAMMKEVKGL